MIYDKYSFTLKAEKPPQHACTVVYIEGYFVPRGWRRRSTLPPHTVLFDPPPPSNYPALIRHKDLLFLTRDDPFVSVPFAAGLAACCREPNVLLKSQALLLKSHWEFIFPNQSRQREGTMLEWTVACSMYLAMPVTNAFRSSKLVLKLGFWKQTNKNVKCVSFHFTHMSKNTVKPNSQSRTGPIDAGLLRPDSVFPSDIAISLTWYMSEEGRGSMHGCWSGSGSSSSRSTLDRASSKVTADVMLLEKEAAASLQPEPKNTPTEHRNLHKQTQLLLLCFCFSSNVTVKLQN